MWFTYILASRIRRTRSINSITRNIFFLRIPLRFKMKAINVTKLVKTPTELAVGDVPEPTPATCPADSVIIKVRGIGLNFLETLMIQGWNDRSIWSL